MQQPVDLVGGVVVDEPDAHGTAVVLEPEGAVRVGIVHYNTADEVDRLLEALGSL